MIVEGGKRERKKKNKPREITKQIIYATNQSVASLSLFSPCEPRIPKQPSRYLEQHSLGIFRVAPESCLRREDLSVGRLEAGLDCGKGGALPRLRSAVGRERLHQGQESEGE